MADPEASKVLVVYGEPPPMDLVDSRGAKLNKTFVLTTANRASFETALRQALGVFLGDHASVANARMIFIADSNAFFATVKNSGARRLIYYGHALSGTNALLPSLGNAITTFLMINVLRGSGITDFDILGCKSTSIAAEMAVSLRGTRLGYLRALAMTRSRSIRRR